MKQGIHPTTNLVKAVCACGATHEITTTLKDDLHLDVCSQCHPFYTGKQNLIDTAGRVDRFRARQQRTSDLQTKVKKS